MRTFLAIDIRPDDNFKKILLDIKQSLTDTTINWVDFSVLHITLAFLGNVRENTISKIQADIVKKSGCFVNFQIQIGNIGIFGTIDNPKVIWVGVKQSEQLFQLHKIINNIVSQHCFIDKTHSFKPHITIGRIKQLTDINVVNNAVQKYGDRIFQNIQCNKITMYHSILKPKGPIYKPLFEQRFR